MHVRAFRARTGSSVASKLTGIAGGGGRGVELPGAPGLAGVSDAARPAGSYARRHFGPYFCCSVLAKLVKAATLTVALLLSVAPNAA